MFLTDDGVHFAGACASASPVHLAQEPGIEFSNQRVEAAYRKGSCSASDDPARVDPPTVSELSVPSPELLRL